MGPMLIADELDDLGSDAVGEPVLLLLLLLPGRLHEARGTLQLTRKRLRTHRHGAHLIITK